MTSTDPPTTSSSEGAKRKLKILMLHGYQQSGSLFHAKTRVLEKALQKAFPAAPAVGHLPAYPGGVSLIYPTAPIRLHATDLPSSHNSSGTGSRSGDAGASASASTSGTATPKDDNEQPEAYGWWIRDEQTGEYNHFERGLSAIAETLEREGDVAGAIGFSQGAGAAAIVASLLEEGRREAFTAAGKEGKEPAMAFPESFLREGDSGKSRMVHAPLKFGIIYSGMAADRTALYRALYEPKVKTPLLHFIGSLDVLVEEARSLRLVEKSVDWNAEPGQEGHQEDTSASRRVIYHPGGHFLPTQKQYVMAVIGFIKATLGKE
ncbi:MAG: hypothetical protein M4579_003145 [Chaenotheca gracillima]|nr:MAG: hypothetical protein M4579_003145 [Chaenotheca gracillima]